MARFKILPVLILLSRLQTLCSAFEAVSTPEFDDELLSLNLSSQIEIDQFLVNWSFDEKETSTQGGNQDSQQDLDPGFTIWRRACPLPGGADCKPTALCCSGSTGAWCCAKEYPVCCGKQADPWCCEKDKKCCGHGCCNPGYSCCGTLYGKAKCCGSGRICCNKETEDGFCCDKDQRCGDNGSCINPATTVTRTTTAIADKSAAKTEVVTSETTIIRTSTVKTTDVVTVSNRDTATQWVTSTVVVTDTPTGRTVTVTAGPARRQATATATLIVTEDSGVVYLRAKASLDPIAHALMARGVSVVRRDTITYTAWVTKTVDSVSTFTVTSTDWDTAYETTTFTDTVTSTTYVSAETTVTSTTTTTTHVLPGETPPPDDDNNNKDGLNDKNKNSTNGSSGSKDKAAIIGGSVGGAAGVIFIALLGFALWKRHERKNAPPSPGDSIPPMVDTRDSMMSPAPTMPSVGGAAVMTPPPKSPPQSYSPYSQTSTAIPPVGGYGQYPSTNPSPGPMVGQNVYDQNAYDPNQPVYEIGQTYPRDTINEIYTAPVVHEADTVYPHERGGVAELGTGMAPASPPPGPPDYQYHRQ